VVFVMSRAKRRRTDKTKRLGKIKTRRPPRDLIEALRAVGPIPSYTSAFTVEQAAEVAKQRVEWEKRRAAIVETHRKRSRLSDPDLVQERHSPTVEVAVDDPEAKKRARRNITRVRQSEAWRHNQLNPMQRQAETEMHTAWQLRTAGLSAAVMKLDRTIAGAAVGNIERAAYLDETWREWCDAAHRRQISLAVVVMVLAEPRTLAEVERACHLRRGEAIEVYMQALDLWATVRGWLRAGRTVDRIGEWPSKT
jgi:hypothetical protein